MTGYDAEEYEDHDWATTVEYRVEWQSGNTWCGYIPGHFECYEIRPAPDKVFAHSEVHGSSLNELDTIFTNVYFLDVNDQWLLFDQSHWWEQTPYSVDKWYLYEFHNHGP